MSETKFAIDDFVITNRQIDVYCRIVDGGEMSCRDTIPDGSLGQVWKIDSISEPPRYCCEVYVGVTRMTLGRFTLFQEDLVKATPQICHLDFLEAMRRNEVQ